MPAAIRTPRSRWVEEGLAALAGGGPDAVRVEPLAGALGVTKGGFYWHFEGRSAFLDELLDHWERVSVDEVIERVEGAGGDARERLRTLFGIASSGRHPMRVELAIRDWARRDRRAAARLRRVDNRRFAYMRELFGELTPDPDEVEVRCTVAFSLFVGNPFIAADHDGRSRREVLELALERLLD